MGWPRWKIVTLAAVGFVLVTSLSALASSSAGKNFFKNFGRASVATLNDVSGRQDLKLAAEVEINPAATSLQITENKKAAESKNENAGTVPLKEIPAPVSIKPQVATPSIAAVITSSPIVKEIEKNPAEMIAVATTAPPPPPEILEPTSTPAQLAQQETLKPVLICAVQIFGANTDDDSITLINPNGKQVDISKWRLAKKTKTGSEDSIKVISEGSFIPPNGKFVWANSGYSAIVADVRTSGNLAKNNSVALLDENKNIIDQVAWGSGTNQFTEGSPVENPENGQIIRKMDGDIPIDTNDNLSDFEIK